MTKISDADRISRTRRLFRHIRHSNRHWRRLALFSLIWCVVVPLSAAIVLLLSGWHADTDIAIGVLPYVPGALLGGYLGALIATMISEEKSGPVRFAAFFLSVGCTTLLVTAFIYALHFRIYFSEFHQSFGTLIWVFQTVFTGLGSLYLFAASAARILFPFAVIALFIASIGFSRGWLTRTD